MAAPELGYKVLNSADVEHFLAHGWVRIPQAFTPEQAAEWTKTLWVRLGYDADDKTTWTRERVHMPFHRREPVVTCAPKAWHAMCDLVGGAERIDMDSAAWGDGFIVNLGTPEHAAALAASSAERRVVRYEDMMNPADLDNWHVDGDFFVHFLDSPEQALLVIPIYAPIAPLGGGTFFCPSAIPRLAEYLYAHPEGCVPTGGGFASSASPYLTWGPPLVLAEQPPAGMPHARGQPVHANPAPWPAAPHPERLAYTSLVEHGMDFVEVTGDPGDVVLAHPLMLHSAARNYTRAPRVLTNPPLALRAPFCFSRADGAYSLVEQKTLMALGLWDHAGTRGAEWVPTAERRRIVPRRLVGADYGKAKAEEAARLASWATSCAAAT